jgi:hypothetical protein
VAPHLERAWAITGRDELIHVIDAVALTHDALWYRVSERRPLRSERGTPSVASPALCGSHPYVQHDRSAQERRRQAAKRVGVAERRGQRRARALRTAASELDDDGAVAWTTPGAPVLSEGRRFFLDDWLTALMVSSPSWSVSGPIPARGRAPEARPIRQARVV